MKEGHHAEQEHQASGHPTSRRVLSATHLPARFYALAAPATGTQACSSSVQMEPGSMSVADLKRLYLACDEASAAARLDAAAYPLCGAVAEILKPRAFGGDLEMQLTWRRSAKTHSRADDASTGMRRLEAAAPVIHPLSQCSTRS